jgi:uncharacterized protein (DUF3084 family)
MAHPDRRPLDGEGVDPVHWDLAARARKPRLMALNNDRQDLSEIVDLVRCVAKEVRERQEQAEAREAKANELMRDAAQQIRAAETRAQAAEARAEEAEERADAADHRARELEEWFAHVHQTMIDQLGMVIREPRENVRAVA